jgi:hypothetical protein
MAENLPNGVIHTLDLPQESRGEDAGLPIDSLHLISKRQVGREFRDWEGASRIIQHFGDSATRDFRQAGNPTFFFIDGAHTYEYCRSDSEKCIELCGGKGVFLWHDCDTTHPGVVQLQYEWHEMGREIVRIYRTSLAYWKAKSEKVG